MSHGNRLALVKFADLPDELTRLPPMVREAACLEF